MWKLRCVGLRRKNSTGKAITHQENRRRENHSVDSLAKRVRTCISSLRAAVTTAVCCCAPCSNLSAPLSMVLSLGFLWISRLVIDCVVVVVCCVLCAVPFGRQLPFWRVGTSALRLAPSRPRRHSLLYLSPSSDCVSRSSDNSHLLFAPLLSSIHQHAVVQCALCCHRTPALLVHFLHFQAFLLPVQCGAACRPAHHSSNLRGFFRVSPRCLLDHRVPDALNCFFSCSFPSVISRRSSRTVVITACGVHFLLILHSMVCFLGIFLLGCCHVYYFSFFSRIRALSSVDTGPVIRGAVSGFCTCSRARL